MTEGVVSSHKTSTFGRARRRTLQPAGSSRHRRIHPRQAERVKWSALRQHDRLRRVRPDGERADELGCGS